MEALLLRTQRRVERGRVVESAIALRVMHAGAKRAGSGGEVLRRRVRPRREVRRRHTRLRGCDCGRWRRLDGCRSWLWFENGIVAQTLALALVAIAAGRVSFVALPKIQQISFPFVDVLFNFPPVE